MSVFREQKLRKKLLLVLKYLELLLNNNVSELGVRVQFWYRYISHRTMGEAGAKARSEFMSIVVTSIKLVINP